MLKYMGMDPIFTENIIMGCFLFLYGIAFQENFILVLSP